MGIPKESEASIDLPVSTDVAWRLLGAAAGADVTEPGTIWQLEHSRVAVDAATPGEGAGGLGAWDGIEYRVSAHLVPRGAEQTLLVLTADPGVEQHGPLGEMKSSASHRHARRDLATLAAAVGRLAEGDDADAG
jgi:hypothetical protein